MVLPPKQLFVRLVFWVAVFAWAVWKIRDLSSGDLVVPELLGPPPAVGPVPIPPPAVRPAEAAGADVPRGAPPEGAPPEGAPPELVDPEAAVAAMDEAARAAEACGVAGTIGVRLGADGLAEAWLTPASSPPDTTTTGCLTAALWERAWPRTALGFEMERPIGAH